MSAPAFTDSGALPRAGVGADGARAPYPRSLAEVVVVLRWTFGYLDAGTGSMIVQLFLGGIAAIVVAVRLWWNRLLRLLRIRRPEAPVLAREPGAEETRAESARR
jgi:hypothetical protein